MDRSKKYLVLYKKPWQDNQQRTRVSNLKTAKQRFERFKSYGWQASIIPKSEFSEELDSSKKALLGLPKNRINYWEFIPDKNGDLHCRKNGQFVKPNHIF